MTLHAQTYLRGLTDITGEEIALEEADARAKLLISSTIDAVAAG